MEGLNELNERYDLMKERISALAQDASFCGVYGEYIGFCARFLEKIFYVYETIGEKGRTALPLDWWQEQNRNLYADILPSGYEKSFANPDYAVKQFGKEMGQRLCFLYTELRSLIPSAYEQCLWDLVVFSELFVEVETIIASARSGEAFRKSGKDSLSEEQKPSDDAILIKEIQTIIYDFERDYSEVIVARRLRNQLDSSMDFATSIIMESDLCDESYLYYYGEYIGENERTSREYLAGLSEQQLYNMAFTYTDGFREGFEIAGIDLSKKKTVNIRYNIGFEPMVRQAVIQFEALGLKPSIYPAAAKSLDKQRHLRIGYTATSANKQYDYDHRFDNALYLDKAFLERRYEVLSKAYEEYKELCSYYAGPACIEVFGEKDFTPVSKENALSLDEQQQKLTVKWATQSAKLSNHYIPRDQYSFTIIAYPVAEIGSDYQCIFEETIKVNNLDKKRYRNIQQCLIDALDEAEYVRVLGTNGNHTDMKVMLHVKKNPEKETNFENCLADVNIPVGEVFTSPKLTGTTGCLHVSSVYLNDLDFKNLTLHFEDGKVVSYSCDNFDDDKDNLAFVKENLMNHRETLPLGEFAIGTNTTAYVMARKYNILHKLPILIVEKMGPHFAVGDTCYSHSEEVRLFNPDGKEIVAKDNECSLLRDTNEEEAYFNVHTDITIPYEEIGLIEAVRFDGSTIPLLRNGEFVLAGTEELNII